MRKDTNKINEIMENAQLYGGNKTPKPERVTVEGEREKLLGRVVKPETKEAK